MILPTLGGLGMADEGDGDVEGVQEDNPYRAPPNEQDAEEKIKLAPPRVVASPTDSVISAFKSRAATAWCGLEPQDSSKMIQPQC